MASLNRFAQLWNLRWNFEQVGSVIEIEVELEWHGFFEGWLICLYKRSLHDEKQLQLTKPGLKGKLTL